MEILISMTSAESLYEQIETQIKKQILSGEIKAGGLMPSIRVLAKELRIGVITAKRAYDDLVSDGFLMSRSGKGYYVCGVDAAMKKKEYIGRIAAKADEIIRLSGEGGVTEREIYEIIKGALEKK